MFSFKSLLFTLPSCWQEIFDPFLSTKEARQLEKFLQSEYEKGITIYPAPENIFKAFSLTPYKQVKVVILGQDPYHGPLQAQGLSFSVPDHLPRPPSLRNIFQELTDDLQCPSFDSNDLTPWARQGVLLLNSTLTVAQSAPLSHSSRGWEDLTHRVISALSKREKQCVFVLWGSKAIKKASLIDINKHRIFQSAHPSPLSAYRGFFGSKVFSKINAALEQAQEQPISWPLS